MRRIGIYHVADKRNQLKKLLKEVLIANQDKQIMLIAHSIGYIVAYDVLHELGQETKAVSIDHWVTLGCPLGLRYVQSQNTASLSCYLWLSQNA